MPRDPLFHGGMCGSLGAVFLPPPASSTPPKSVDARLSLHTVHTSLPGSWFPLLSLSLFIPSVCGTIPGGVCSCTVYSSCSCARLSPIGQHGVVRPDTSVQFQKHVMAQYTVGRLFSGTLPLRFYPFSYGVVRQRPLRRTKWGIDLPRREKKRKIFSSETFSERIILLMSSHDTPGADPHQASAAHTHMIEEISDLLLQACGLDQEPCPDQLSQIQQDGITRRGRGRTPQVSGTQLWSSLRLGALQGMHSFADWRRLLGLQSIGPFAPLWLTRNGLVSQLLQAGLVPLQEVWEAVNARLAFPASQAAAATLAAFAPEILCLDETRLDAVGRYLKPRRGLSAHAPACFAGKLIGLFDLRAQRWLRLEWREAVQENCRVDMLDFLQGLSVGSLLLFDLGYFSFSFFDTLTQWKLWWVSRYRENTSYRIAHVFYRQREV